MRLVTSKLARSATETIVRGLLEDVVAGGLEDGGVKARVRLDEGFERPIVSR